MRRINAGWLGWLLAVGLLLGGCHATGVGVSARVSYYDDPYLYPYYYDPGPYFYGTSVYYDPFFFYPSFYLAYYDPFYRPYYGYPVYPYPYYYYYPLPRRHLRGRGSVFFVTPSPSPLGPSPPKQGPVIRHR